MKFCCTRPLPPPPTDITRLCCNRTSYSKHTHVFASCVCSRHNLCNYIETSSCLNECNHCNVFTLHIKTGSCRPCRKHDLALQDLRNALKIAPDNQELQRLHSRVQTEFDAQNAMTSFGDDSNTPGNGVSGCNSIADRKLSTSDCDYPDVAAHGFKVAAAASSSNAATCDTTTATPPSSVANHTGEMSTFTGKQTNLDHIQPQNPESSSAAPKIATSSESVDNPQAILGQSEQKRL